MFTRKVSSNFHRHSRMILMILFYLLFFHFPSHKKELCTYSDLRPVAKICLKNKTNAGHKGEAYRIHHKKKCNFPSEHFTKFRGKKRRKNCLQICQRIFFLIRGASRKSFQKLGSENPQIIKIGYHEIFIWLTLYERHHLISISPTTLELSPVLLLHQSFSKIFPVESFVM